MANASWPGDLDRQREGHGAKSLIRRPLFIPFLYTLLSLFQLNYIASNVVSPDQLIRPLIVLWLIVALLIWPAYQLTRNWNWAALLLTIFVLGFLSSAAFFSTVLAFGLIFGIFWLAVLRLAKRKISLVHFMYVPAGTGLFFVAYAIVLLVTMLTRFPWTSYSRSINDARNYSLETLSNPSTKPDIYYIVLDGYARSDILQELFAFDNSDLVKDLQQEGFVVPASNHSNYPVTPLSIASTVNMDYVQAFAPALKANPHHWLMAPFIDHSRVRSLLEAQGYRTISISTNWTITDNPTADLYLHPFPVMLTDFEGFVLDMTPLQFLEPLLGTFASLPNDQSHREVVRYNFDALAELPRIPGPKFVFAHIISPHPPFVFDKDGNPIDSQSSFTFQDANEFPGSAKEYAQRYIEQVQFVNRNLREVIKAILERSGTPPIIIVQADHGSGLLTDLTSPDRTCIHERFAPFAAYYLPGVGSDAIPSDISSVNIFRIILDEYFEAGLPLLRSRQYFYKAPQTFYDFEDVTSRIDVPCAVTKH